jgi:hypothetical protein
VLLGGDREQSDAAPDQQGGRGDLPTTRAALVVAHGAEDVLQVVVGTGDVGSAIAHEQTGPIAGGHFQEVAHRRLERTDRVGLLADLREQASVGLTQRTDVSPRCVVQQVGCPMQPAEGKPDRRPLVGRAGEPMSDQVTDAPEFAGEPPFSATRSREV